MANTNEPNYRSFAPITSYDHAGYIWISMLYGMTLCLLVLGIRVWYKRTSFGRDDSLFVVASIAMMAHIICIAVALKNGLGTSPALAPPKSHAVRSQAIAGPATMAAYMFLLVALAFAKSSTVMFIQRILSRDLRRLYVTCYALIAVYCLWAIGSMAAIGVGCDAGLFTSDDMDTSCGGQGRKWAAIAALDTITELSLMIMPVIIIWPLQLSFQVKVQVAAAFAFRLGVVALSVAHAVSIARVSSSPNPGVAFVPAIVFAECELCWSLISATIPNLKAFMKTFNTGFGHNDFKHQVNSTGYTFSGSRTHDEGMQLQSMNAAKLNNHLRPDRGVYEVEIMRSNLDDGRSVGSGHSQEMIIRKTVDHEVTYEHKRRPTKGSRIM